MLLPDPEIKRKLKVSRVPITWAERCKSALAVGALLLLVGGFYLRPEFLLGTGSLVGLDYDQLHIRRLAFAREALWGSRHTLPAWYPHEFLGSPFAANLQSFPWIPTRLLLLLLDPSVAYAAGIALAAGLAAVFTYLYCRNAGLTRVGAMAAGVTFAGSGFFASRVMAGHLPLLEAYPALPLLLWLVDRAIARERQAFQRFDLAALACCSACVVAAGHPQLPAYSIASAFLYAGWRARGWLRARVMAAMVCGVGIALALWLPMFMLIGRSTRVLHLVEADNNVVMPYSRLLALVIPWIHGWASPVTLADQQPFLGYPNNAWFWDTASYVGVLPLVAILALLAGCLMRRRLPESRWRFLACLGAGAFLCSLPLAEPLFHMLPGTLLRSPARLLYVSTFCAAVALGFTADAIRKSRWPSGVAVRNVLLLLGLSLHFADLWGFAHRFIQVTPRSEQDQQFRAVLERNTGSGRVAKEWTDASLQSRDRYDDVGGFDSIFLARFSRGMFALAGGPADLQRELIDASEFPVKALEATGVKFVITTKTRTDLQLVGSADDAMLYRVPKPAPRAAFRQDCQARFVPEEKIPSLFAASSGDVLFLPAEAGAEARMYQPIHPESCAAGTLQYVRLSSDEILLQTDSKGPGFAQILESYDPGWTATIDRTATRLLPANGFALAVPVPAGSHTVRLRYRTPGRAAGEYLSLLSFAALIAMLVRVRPGTSAQSY
jgi:hypothetical protein